MRRDCFLRALQVVLLPECDNDPRYRFSSCRTLGGRKGPFAVGLGLFAAGLSYLDAMREQEAEVRQKSDALPRDGGGTALARWVARLLPKGHRAFHRTPGTG